MQSAHLSLFAVDHRSVQVVWRNLRPGRLALSASTGSSVDVHIEAGHDLHEPQAGAVLLDHLPAAASIEIRAAGDALGRRVQLAVSTLPLPPGEVLTRVATVSDLHLGAKAFGHRKTIVEDPTPQVPHPVRCATAAFSAADDWGAEAIVAKGDLTNNGHLDQWRTYADLVKTTEVGVLGMPGNHDRAWRLGTDGLGPEDAASTFGLTMASPMMVVDRPGARLVLVDSTAGRRNRGSLTGVASDVVQALAETEPGSVALVFMHHQLHQHPVHEGWPVGIHRGPTVSFLDRIASTGTPTLVSSGHTHRHRRWEHRGVVVTQVGSTKDYPGVWAGYTVSEGGVSQLVRRVDVPDCITWTDHTRRAAAGAWRWIAPGSLRSRCFQHTW